MKIWYITRFIDRYMYTVCYYGMIWRERYPKMSF